MKKYNLLLLVILVPTLLFSQGFKGKTGGKGKGYGQIASRVFQGRTLQAAICARWEFNLSNTQIDQRRSAVYREN